jgi:hypothetical protein
MDKGSLTTMTIERMMYGGFLVFNNRRPDDYGFGSGPVFASTTIDEALGFIRDAVQPVTAEQRNSGN